MHDSRGKGAGIAATRPTARARVMSLADIMVRTVKFFKSYQIRPNARIME